MLIHLSSQFLTRPINKTSEVSMTSEVSISSQRLQTEQVRDLKAVV
jgi:hypothetical protein